jgi:hypothetical protein
MASSVAPERAGEIEVLFEEVHGFAARCSERLCLSVKCSGGIERLRLDPEA